MEYKHNTLLEAYDVGEHRLVREKDALRIERTPRAPLRQPALFQGSLWRAAWWALRFVLVAAGCAAYLYAVVSFVRAL